MSLSPTTPEIRSLYVYMDMDLKCLDCEQVNKNSSFVLRERHENSRGGVTIFQSLHCPICDSQKHEIVSGSSIKYYINGNDNEKEKID